MSYAGGLNNKMDTATEIGRNPVGQHQIRPKYGHEQADAGRECRIRLARPNPQARTTGIYSFSLTTSRIGNLTYYPVVEDPSLAICDDCSYILSGVLPVFTI